jgi:hypothetical protein
VSAFQSCECQQEGNHDEVEDHNQSRKHVCRRGTVE